MLSGDRVHVRAAQPEDVARIVALNRALFREDAGRRDPLTNQNWPDEQGGEYFTEFFSRDRSLLLLAESPDEVAGYLAGYVREGSRLRPVTVAELESMYVLEKYRNLGLGMRLIGEFLDWAEDAELASVTAYAANETAIRFYQRQGFQPKSMILERRLER